MVIFGDEWGMVYGIARPTSTDYATIAAVRLAAWVKKVPARGPQPGRHGDLLPEEPEGGSEDHRDQRSYGNSSGKCMENHMENNMI